MKKWIIALTLVGVLVAWWNMAAPREEIGCCIAGSIAFNPAIAQKIVAVDQSEKFPTGLETLPLELPAYDDAVFLDDGITALVTAHDGKIWKVDLAGIVAEPLVDVPLMAWGIHEAPGNPSYIYFCSSGSYKNRPPGEVAGLYRLDISTRSIEPLVLKVPDTKINLQQPIVYADNDTNAPEIASDGSGAPSRKIAVCDNLEVSEDGRRIYFSEPFYYENASADDAIDEAIALAPNGRLWRYDIESGATRLIAEGFHFINGILYDPHPGLAREESVIVTQTSLFQVTRFYVNGPKAGNFEVVIDTLPGMPDGMDRDVKGRIWLSMFTERSPLLTWMHENAWIKPLLMRLPTSLLLSQTQRTGVVVLSPDGSKPLYSAFYKGPELASIASAVPVSSGIYLANVALDSPDRGQKKGIQRLQWPPELK
ncbi:SMP-30/gluconolactonase/LRE family protein [Nitrosomonas communis]|uniref:SMP-30/Gluconolaconase/LRE-like region-containing protein n=1 Tax=Nitrosomonas communis TaxID=44574 RepID=A0A1I4RA30_9PROT|nr:SMP-30/gluconolactonase/LRE family protein [Nitrosomonas communis]SFM49144.1 SMP-30/Gluconolaconase/LRE-like region-containing protein [Nitrosomonas communis]